MRVWPAFPKNEMSRLEIVWPEPVAFPAMEGVHVWCGELDVEADARTICEAVLSDDERQRAARFQFDRDRFRFIVARGMLRRLIGCYHQCAPEAVVFSYGDHGKPGLAGFQEGFAFNTSHANGLGVWAFRFGGDIGVDVEWTGRRVEIDAVARRFFSDREWMALRDLPSDEKRAGFFRCWTQKEAFVKALGRGLAFSLSAFDVAVSGPAALLRVEGMDAAAWVLVELHPAEGYAGALAFEGAEKITLARCTLKH